MFQKGYGLGDLFRNIVRPILKPILKEAKGIGTAVGIDLAENLLSDLVAGKSSKASVKTRGKEVKNLAAQRTLQALLRGHQGGNGSFNGNQVPSGSNLGWSSKTAKRKRSRSKSQTPAKRKRNEPKSQPPKRKRTQTGGVSPPIHYPLGNYPRGRIMKGGKLKRTQSKSQPPKRKRIQTGGFIWRPSTGLVKGGGKRKQTKKRTKKVNPENKREDVKLGKNVNHENILERNVKPENKRKDVDLV